MYLRKKLSLAISGKLRQLRQIFSAPKFVRIRYLLIKKQKSPGDKVGLVW